MENEYPEITAIQPHEPGETPDGYVKMPIPFVGIYQSLLGGDIDHYIDHLIECADDAHIEIKIHYDEIYKSIALYTAELLGIEGAIYAGTVCPKYYNYADDQPYLFVPRDWYEKNCGKLAPCEILDFLSEGLSCEVDPWYLEEYGGIDGEYVAQAVYAQWVNGTNNGLEELYENLEVEHIDYLE